MAKPFLIVLACRGNARADRPGRRAGWCGMDGVSPKGLPGVGVARPRAHQVPDRRAGLATIPGRRDRSDGGAAEVCTGSLGDREAGELGQGQSQGSGPEDAGGQQREVAGRRSPPGPARAAAAGNGRCHRPRAEQPPSPRLRPRRTTASLLASSMWAVAQVRAPGHRLIQ